MNGTRTESESSTDSDQRRLSCPAKVTDILHCGKVEKPTYGNTLETPDVYEKRKRHRQTRILKFKDELERVYYKFKRAGTHVKGGIEIIKARLSPSREMEGRRNIRIEYDDSPKKKSRSHETLLDDDDCFFDFPDHNYSPSLVIHPLREGRFSAEISLDNFPQEDDIIVRVQNYRLEILLHKKLIGKKHHSISRPFPCGEIDLPIYVDPMSLQFTVEDDSLLTIEARCKGFLSRRLSISSEDLEVKRPSRQAKSPVVKRKLAKNNTTTKWYVTDHGENKRSHPEAHRTRSNTR